ncbi:MAG: peptide ABC transporter substrate-binding protein [Oscillospiraceae bacterium]|nr:peptide ABC transporter substrate-binding protein [Oscillospiraceae bacterium]
MYRKILSALTAVVVSFSMVALTGCEKEAPEGAGYTFEYALAGNPESLDPQFSTNEYAKTVIANMFTGLMKNGDDGKLEKAIAEDYSVSADGLKYTFTLKNNCFWYYDADRDNETDDNEVTPVTAYDFEFAFRRIFNPETRSPHTEDYRCLKNAGKIASGIVDYTEIGVKAKSDTELVFELDYPSAEFLQSLTFTAAMPCNQQFFENTKGRYGLDDKSVPSNGAFYIKQWFYDPYGSDNFIYMSKNSVNDEFDRIYPSSLNFYIKKSKAEADEAFSSEGSNVLISHEYDKKKYEKNDAKGYFSKTLGIIINPDNKQYGNINIRKALAYGIDKEAFAAELPEDMTAAYGVIPPGVTFLNRSYREINSDRVAAVAEDGTLIEYDSAAALEYYEKGMKSMGLESLENIKILVPENCMNTEYLHLVTQNWQTLFGFFIGIEEVPQDEYDSRLKNGEYTMAIYPLSGEYNSPLSVLENFLKDNNSFGYSNVTLTSVVEELSKLASFNEGVETYNKAEKIILNDFEFIPVFYKQEFSILDSGNHDIIYDPFTGQLDFRYAKYYN